MIFRKFSTSCRTLAKVIPKNLKGKSVSSQLWLQRQLSDPYVEKARMLNYRSGLFPNFIRKKKGDKKLKFTDVVVPLSSSK